MNRMYLLLDTHKKVEALCDICEKYRTAFDVDVRYGTYMVDGISVLGVLSLLGHVVQIRPITKDNDARRPFFTEIEKIGGYMV